jgi:hypothetical protein
LISCHSFGSEHGVSQEGIRAKQMKRKKPQIVRAISGMIEDFSRGNGSRKDALTRHHLIWILELES